jgi:hypothetical protein
MMSEKDVRNSAETTICHSARVRRSKSSGSGPHPAAVSEAGCIIVTYMKLLGWACLHTKGTDDGTVEDFSKRLEGFQKAWDVRLPVVEEGAKLHGRNRRGASQPVSQPQLQ